LSEDFIDEFSDKLDWATVLWKSPNLSVDLLEKHHDKIDWFKLSKHQRCLAEEYLYKNKDLLNWRLILKRYKLSEPLVQRLEGCKKWKTIQKYLF